MGGEGQDFSASTTAPSGSDSLGRPWWRPGRPVPGVESDLHVAIMPQGRTPFVVRPRR